MLLWFHLHFHWLLEYYNNISIESRHLNSIQYLFVYFKLIDIFEYSEYRTKKENKIAENECLCVCVCVFFKQIKMKLGMHSALWWFSIKFRGLDWRQRWKTHTQQWYNITQNLDGTEVIDWLICQRQRRELQRIRFRFCWTRQYRRSAQSPRFSQSLRSASQQTLCRLQ